MSKKLFVGGLMVLITVGAFAQKERKGRMADLSPDQRAELKTKKMALHLDLTNEQQKKVYDLSKEQAVKREAKRKEMKTLREKGEKPTENDLFERKNARLDAQLAHQESMKNILNEEQFDTWRKSRKQQGDKMRKKGKRKMKEHNSKEKRGKKRLEDN